MTGRSEIVKDETLNSLKDAGVEYDHLKMRGEGNQMKDYVLKSIWIDKYVGLQRIKVVFDDRDPVITSLRKKGLNVIDVKELDKQPILEGDGIPSSLKVKM